MDVDEFEELHLPDDIAVEVDLAPARSKGILPRVRTLLAARRVQADVHHVTGDTTFQALLLPKRRTIVTLHDFEFLDRKGPLRRFLFRLLWVQLPVLRASVVTADSPATADDARRWLWIRPRDLRVMPMPLPDGFEDVPSATTRQPPYILLVGTTPNKRVEVSAEALSGLGVAARVIGRLTPAQRRDFERFRWLVTHYVAYGFVGSVIAIAYQAAGLYALAAFAVPLFVMRQTQIAYVAHAQRSTQKLRHAAETIQTQNVSLERANRLLKERSTAAMESLSATVDARDAYTAGHSRRVQTLALAIGRELGLSQTELEVLGHAALFHDIGKLAIPDAILLKPDHLTDAEWALMQKHAGEGASIINRLGFLTDAVPAIRHHHERFDGRGYPDNLAGEDIPLGARIIHVADAFDSMLSTRVYKPARDHADALRELREHAGRQFCPRCVSALEHLVERDELELAYPEAPAVVAVSTGV